MGGDYKKVKVNGWDQKMHLRVSIWTWQAIKIKLPHGKICIQKGIIDDYFCPFGSQQAQDLFHSVYIYAQETWNAWLLWNQISP